MVLADMPSVDHPDLLRLNAITASLEEARSRLLTDGMSRDLAVGLESLTPGIFEGHHINSFTAIASDTKLNVALEAIDFKKGGLIAAGIAVVIGLLAKLFSWLYDRWIEAGRQKGAEERIQRYERELAKMRESFEKERDELAEATFKNSDAQRIKARYEFSSPLGFIYANLAKRVENKELSFKEADRIAAAISYFVVGDRDDIDAIAEYAILNVMAANPTASLNGTLKMALRDPKLKIPTIIGPVWMEALSTLKIIARNLDLLKGAVKMINAGQPPEKICKYVFINTSADIRSFNSPRGGNPTRLFKIDDIKGVESVNDGSGHVRQFTTLPKSYRVTLEPKIAESIEGVRKLYSLRYGFYPENGHLPPEHSERYMLSKLTTLEGRRFLADFYRSFRDGEVEALFESCKLGISVANEQLADISEKLPNTNARIIIEHDRAYYTTSVSECIYSLIDYTSKLSQELGKLFSAELSIKSSCDQALRILEASLQIRK